MGRKRIRHTMRQYRIRYHLNRYRVTDARLAELPSEGTARQMAFVLGVSTFVVYHWINAKGLVAERDGRGPYLIRRANLVEFFRAMDFLRDPTHRGDYD